MKTRGRSRRALLAKTAAWFGLAALGVSRRSHAQAPLLQMDWLAVLAEILGIPKTVSADEVVRRLGVQEPAPLRWADAARRSENLVMERRLDPAGSAEWIVSRSGAGTVFFRVTAWHQGRSALRYRATGEGAFATVGGVGTWALTPGQPLEDRFILGLQLPAGEHEIAISVPPDAGVTTLALHPEALSPVAPLDGWQLDQPLSLGVKAVTLVRLFGWEGFLPPLDPAPRPVPVVGDVRDSNWEVRTLRVVEGGVQTLVTATGALPYPILLDDRLLLPEPKAAVVRLGTLDLAPGDHIVKTPRNSQRLGDVLSIRREATPEAYLEVVRSQGLPEGSGVATDGVGPELMAANAREVRRLFGVSDAMAAAQPKAESPPLLPPRRPVPISPIVPSDL